MDQTPQKQEPAEQKTYHPMVVMQPGERVVCELKRHPIGIIQMYVGAFFAVTLAAIFIDLFLPMVSDQYGTTASQLAPFVWLVGGVLLVTLVLTLFVSTYIYWQNQWVITTDSITQISQNGLFRRQVSQLSLENLEDVTVEQVGILPHLFNYGNLKVETAGERSKFVFPFCANPNQCAREILDTHEKFLEERRNIQNVPGTPN